MSNEPRGGRGPVAGGTLAVSEATEGPASLPFVARGAFGPLQEVRTVLLPAPEDAAAVTLSAGVVPWTHDEPRWLTVVAKVTFAIQRGADARLVAAATPAPVRSADVHHNHQPMARVVAPSDRAPYRPRVDVTVVGDAFAPGAAATTAMNVRFAVHQG